MIPKLGQTPTMIEDMVAALGSLADLSPGFLQLSEPPGGLVLMQPAYGDPDQRDDTGLESLIQAFPFSFPSGPSPNYTQQGSGRLRSLSISTTSSGTRPDALPDLRVFCKSTSEMRSST